MVLCSCLLPTFAPVNIGFSPRVLRFQHVANQIAGNFSCRLCDSLPVPLNASAPLTNSVRAPGSGPIHHGRTDDASSAGALPIASGMCAAPS